MELARAYVLITGRVQGVYFRETTRQESDKVGVTGMVRNIPDGRVEAIFEGDKEAVQKLIDWCHVGPPSARVETVEVLWERYIGDFRNFRIIA